MKKTSTSPCYRIVGAAAFLAAGMLAALSARPDDPPPFPAGLQHTPVAALAQAQASSLLSASAPGAPQRPD